MANARKLRLEIDQLNVESFDTSGIVEGRGTVRGHDPVNSLTANGGGLGCQCLSGINTCGTSCQPTCYEISCAGPGCENNETLYQTCMDTCAWEGGQPVVCAG